MQGWRSSAAVPWAVGLVVLIVAAGCGRRPRPIDSPSIVRDGGLVGRSDAPMSRPLRVDGSAVRCTPGSDVTVGCGCADLGSCSGDPVLSVCGGDELESSCSSTSSPLARNDDTCGRCPLARVVCPRDGILVLGVRGFGSEGYSCQLGAVER